MRTTLDIDIPLLQEAMQVTGARSRRDVVHLSLKELVRRKRIEELAAMVGTDVLDIDRQDLERMRTDD